MEKLLTKLSMIFNITRIANSPLEAYPGNLLAGRRSRRSVLSAVSRLGGRRQKRRQKRHYGGEKQENALLSRESPWTRCSL